LEIISWGKPWGWWWHSLIPDRGPSDVLHTNLVRQNRKRPGSGNFL
jgi:hypothetical protein